MKFKIEQEHKEYNQPYKPYYKRHIFCIWRQMGKSTGYLTIEEALDVIANFIEVSKKIKEMEGMK